MDSGKKSKIIGYILGIFAFIAIVVGATYAWLTWRSNSITLSGSSECFDVVYYKRDLGTAQNPAKLTFMTDYNHNNLNQLVTNQNYAEVGLSLDPNCANLAGLGKIYLTTNVNTSNAILTGGLYYTLTKVENSTETFIKSGAITSTGDMLLLENIFVSTTSTAKYRVYLWINGPITTDPNYVGASYIGEIRAEVTSQEDTTPPVYAADYITNLYTDATKSTATVNSITYNLAPSVNLMNDRHASMSTDINGGDIRYYGANPDNYVWLGDTFTTDYTYTYNGSSITRTAGSKKLWRIVGVFDGRLKLVSNDLISSQGLSWDTSENSINNGYGINQWGPSGNYEGADLMRLLNPGYENESVNNSLYWTKGTGTVYTGIRNATTSSVSFANTGLTTAEKTLIDTATWYTGAYDNFSYVDAHYIAERGNMGKICSSTNIDRCNDEVTRTSTWSGKVGLIYASDSGYAADLSQCNQVLNSYSETGCYDTDWLKLPEFYWTISSRARSDRGSIAFYVYNDGELATNLTNSTIKVRTAVYLKHNVMLSGGTGTELDPYVLS